MIIIRIITTMMIIITKKIIKYKSKRYGSLGSREEAP